MAEERLAGGVAGRGRLALLGALLGMSVATEYQAAPPAALFLLHAAAAVRPRTAWNLGEKLGLHGLPTLLPLAGLVLRCGIPLAQWTGAPGSGSSPPR